MVCNRADSHGSHGSLSVGRLLRQTGRVAAVRSECREQDLLLENYAAWKKVGKGSRRPSAIQLRQILTDIRGTTQDSTPRSPE